MKTFLADWANRAWEAMFKREKPPEKDSDSQAIKCQGCKKDAEDNIVYRCRECLHGLHLCKKCCLERHKFNPLHVMEEWDDERGFWLKVHLVDLGMVINLGHEGEKCPCSGKRGTPMVMIHENGIQSIEIRYCKCALGSDHCLQLIENGFWPATWERTSTVMTIKVMHQYQLLSAQSQVQS